MMSDLSRMSIEEACRIIRLPKAIGTPKWYKARVKIMEAIRQGYELCSPEEKRCEYCNYDRDDYISTIDKQGHLVLEPYEAVLKVKFYGNKMQTKINYCPMCGRRLGEVNSDDTWRSN